MCWLSNRVALSPPLAQTKWGTPRAQGSDLVANARRAGPVAWKGSTFRCIVSTHKSDVKFHHTPQASRPVSGAQALNSASFDHLRCWLATNFSHERTTRDRPMESFHPSSHATISIIPPLEAEHPRHLNDVGQLPVGAARRAPLPFPSLPLPSPRFPTGVIPSGPVPSYRGRLVEPTCPAAGECRGKGNEVPDNKRWTGSRLSRQASRRPPALPRAWPSLVGEREPRVRV